MNTKEAIDVLHDLTHELGGNDRVAARMGAAALEREEKLQELVAIWRRDGWPIFACDAIESVLNGKKP